jgi:hypothetical protein
VSKIQKILIRILNGTADKNIEFSDLLILLNHLDFSMRIKGSHHIFYREGVDEIINLQPDGKNAKPYQVKQVRNIILRYKLAINIDEH